MILPSNASLIVSAVRHLIKLGGRIDSLAAEKTAVQSDLVLRLPDVATPSPELNAVLLDEELKRTRGTTPDPFGADRAALEKAVKVILRDEAEAPDGFDALFRRYFPDTGLLASPDREYLKRLADAFPGVDWHDPGARIAAFAISAGSDAKRIGYNARMALSVVDTLLEFGAENTALFVRDEGLRGIAETVLQRLARPEWDTFERWNPLLQATLKSALDAALDVAVDRPTSNPWLAGVLDALVQARQGAGDRADDYLLGLVRGRGFHELLGKVLLVAGDRLDAEDAPVFQRIAADVLRDAAPWVVDGTPDFRRFFNERWGDLLRAGLTSVGKHGDQIFAGADPVVSRVILAMVGELRSVEGAGLLSGETVHALADAAIGVVAAEIATLPAGGDRPWLRDFLVSAAATAKKLTARHLFTTEGAEAVLRDAVGALARHPDLLVRKPGLAQELAGEVLTALQAAPDLQARTLATAGLRAAFGAIARDPSLAGRPLGGTVAAVATALAEMVGQRTLTADDAAALLSTAVEATLRNPDLLTRAENAVATSVLRAVQAALPDSKNEPWLRPMFAELAHALLLVVARSGGSAEQAPPAAAFEAWLRRVLAAGVKQAALKLGRGVDLVAAPALLARFVEQVLRAGRDAFDPDSPGFAAAVETLFAEIVSTT